MIELLFLILLIFLIVVLFTLPFLAFIYFFIYLKKENRELSEREKEEFFWGGMKYYNRPIDHEELDGFFTMTDSTLAARRGIDKLLRQ